MCTVGIDRRLSMSSFGWPGENACPSLPQQNSELYDGMTGTSSLETDGYLLNARLVLSEEFEELDVHSRVPIASLKLYLTDTELIVAKVSEDIMSGKRSLTHLRTHDLKEVDIEVDAEDPSVMCLQTRFGRRFLYRLRRGAAGLSSWMNRVFRLKRSSVSPASSSTATLDERTDQQVSSLSAASLRPVPLLQPNHPFHEWHGEHSSDFCSLTQQPDISESKSNPEVNNLLNTPGKKKPVLLQRRKAFRVSDLDSFRNNAKLRSSSVPPEEQLEMLTKSSTSTNSIKDDDLSIDNSEDMFISPSRHSSVRKGKLKISPRARKFTRALSARLIPTSVNSPLSNEEKVVEVRRVKSLNSNTSSTLPRSMKPNGKKERRSKSKLIFLENQDPIVVPSTPTKPKSPGSILRLFHRKATPNSLNLEELISSMEDTELTGLDVYNKPNHFKLYLQNPRTLAEELTLIDAEIFRSIDASELQNGAWTKKTKHSTSPNILKMIDSFNRLARVVCTEIVHEKTVNSRAKAITSYIQVIGKLYKMHNYNSMKAIVAGLQSQAVYRLEKSWSQIPSRRRKKFDKYANILSELDKPDQLQRQMQHNVEHKIQCVPYLGWLLTYVLHSQTLKKLQEEQEVVPIRHHLSAVSGVGKRNSWRESLCSLSLPSSPVPSDTEMSDVITISSPSKKKRSSELLHFIKSLSETNMQQFVDDMEDSSATPGSPRDEVDFSFPPTEKYLHPLAINVTVEVHHPISLNDEQHTSSDSSVEESVQTDSAIGLDSSIGQPSPAHGRRNGLTKSDRDKVIRFSGRLNQKMHSESMPSLTFELDSEYVLPLVDSYFDDNEDESDAEVNTDAFHNSFMGTSSSLSHSHSPSPLSPSMISFSLISEPSTEHNTPRKERSQNRLTSIKHYECESVASSLIMEAYSALFNSVCGIMFSSCPNSVDRIDSMNNIPYFQPGVPFETIISRIQDFFDCKDTNQTDPAKFSTPVSSSSNLGIQDFDESDQKTIITLPSVKESSSDMSQKNRMPSPPAEHQGVWDDSDNVFLQYQRNTLNYTCELSSKGYMRCLINNVPWLDENQCHQISTEVEPS